jgi:polysaccharide export outer membrane protein
LADLGNLDVISSVLPVDVIYDQPAAPTSEAQPVKAAAWGEATVQRAPLAETADQGKTTIGSAEPTKAAAWSEATVTPAPSAMTSKTATSPTPNIKVADGWHADDRMVSPAPVGPPRMVAAPPPSPVLWGPAVVVTAGPSGGPTGYEPYILDTADKVRVFVYGQPNLSRLYIVDQVGNIAIPLIGTVRARGRTTVDLERTIAAKLGREFVKDPQVTVDVAQNRPFFILGEVRLPGQYPFVSGMTIEQAVAIGGGYTERASERSFRITRKLGPLIDQIEAPSDYTLLPGDTVYVHERFF